MATYTVNISGTLNSSYAYATLNGTKTTTAGTKTYTSKPTIAVYVSSSNSYARSNCKVTLNNSTVKNGYGSYTLDIGEADIVNITFASARSGSYTYYTCAITTETSTPPDPMAPHDGHNTNIGQVARQIEGGTVRLGGIGREIESGLVLANGVAREIEFDFDFGPVVLTVANQDNYYNKYNANYAYAMVGDTRLDPDEMSSMEVPYDTIVTIKIKATNSSNPAKVIVNGTTTFQNSDTRAYTTHEYVAKRNAKITYSTQIIYIDEE